MMSVLFVSPHPDDIEIFCGASLLAHYCLKDGLFVVMVTRGGLGTIHPRLRGERMEHIREQEARARYADLPEVAIEWLGMSDGSVCVTSDAVCRMEEFLVRIQPDMIYLPESEKKYSIYRHEDHFQATKIVEKALAAMSRPACLRYYHTRKYNTFVDVTKYFAENQRALFYYKSQAGFWANPPFLLPMLALWQRWVCARQGKRFGCKYAEVFREIHPPVR